MLNWKIGDVTVTRIVEIEVPFVYSEEHAFIPEARPEVIAKMRWLYPHYVTPDGDLILSIHALLVDAPGLRVVVDTCLGNDKPRPEIGMEALQTPFLSQMAEAGWSPESVDVVVCTHLHMDHVGWNTMLKDGQWVPTFPKARYLIGRTEHAHWSSDDDPAQGLVMADSVKPIFDAGLADLVEMDHKLSPEVRLTPSPGHTPGHVSVVIESRGQTALITGDAMHHPCQMAHPEWCPGVDVDKTLSPKTRRAMLEGVVDSSTLLIGTHFSGPTAGHVVRDGNGYRLEA